MTRKLKVTLFFMVVFGLPVGWYLFLQLFGENKFDLPRLQMWDQDCLPVEQTTLWVEPAVPAVYPAAFRRVSQALGRRAGIVLLQDSLHTCSLAFAMYLIDEEGWVRGQYAPSREEVDRLLAEMDVLLQMNDK